jgi:hypothetical protein
MVAPGLRIGIAKRHAAPGLPSPVAKTFLPRGRRWASRLPLAFPRTDHCRVVGVLYLESVPRTPRPVGRAQPLRHNALEAHAARVPEGRGAVLVGVVAQNDAEPAPAEQPRQALLAVDQRQSAEVLAAELEQVKAVRIASLTVPRRCWASNTATQSGPHRTASPSSVNDLARSSIARALDQLAKDRMQNFQARADEAFTNLLRKHGRPTDLKMAFRQSVARVEKRSPAASVKRCRERETAGNDNEEGPQVRARTRRLSNR